MESVLLLGITTKLGAISFLDVALVVISVFGIQNHLRLMKQPRTHKLCVASMLVFWFTLLLYSGVHILTAGIEVGMIIFLARLLLAKAVPSAIGFGLGLAGFIDYKKYPDQYDTGIKQATWGVILNTAQFFFAIVWVFVIFNPLARDGAPNRPPATSHPISSINDSDLGIAIDLKNTDWLIADRSQFSALGGEEDSPASYVLFTETCFAQLYPIILKDTELTIEEITASMLESGENVTVIEQHEDAASQTYIKHVNTEYEDDIQHCHLFIQRNKGITWVLMGIDKTGSPEDRERFNLLFTRIKSSDIPDGFELPPSLKQQQTTILETLGNHLYYEEEEDEKAYTLFMQAFSYSPERVDLLCDAVDSLDQIYRIKEGQAILEQHREQFRDDPEFRANLAWHWIETGKNKKEALEIYADLFPKKYDDAYYFKHYIEQIVINEQYGKAIDILNQYNKKHELDPEIHLLLLVDIFAGNEQHDIAQAKLKEAETTFGYSSDTGEKTIYYWYTAKEYDKAIEQCNRFIQEFGEEQFACRYMGLSYQELGDLESARKWLQKALEYYPDSVNIRKELAEVTELLQQSRTGTKETMHSSITPTHRMDHPQWVDRYNELCRRAENATDAKVIFIGDSITEFWENTGISAWKQYYAPLSACNLGISGDRTEHVLWRLNNGHIGNLKPKVAVIMIGTNNLNEPPVPAREIADGIIAIVNVLREKLPNTRILLLAIFPREADPCPVRATVEEASRIASKVADGENIVFVDLAGAFLDENKHLSERIAPDTLHLSAEGYRIWAEAMHPHLQKLLED